MQGLAILRPAPVRRKTGMGYLTSADPRKDGYNYGAALGRAALTLAQELEVKRTEVLLKAVEARRLAYSDAAWALEMAIRDVLHGTTAEEQTAAVAKLKSARQANDVLGIDSTYNVANMPTAPYHG